MQPGGRKRRVDERLGSSLPLTTVPHLAQYGGFLVNCDEIMYVVHAWRQ